MSRLLGEKARSNEDHTKMLFKLLCLRSETVSCDLVCLYTIKDVVPKLLLNFKQRVGKNSGPKDLGPGGRRPGNPQTLWDVIHFTILYIATRIL